MKAFLLFLLILTIVAGITGVKNSKSVKKAKTENKLKEILNFLNLDQSSFLNIKTALNETQCIQDVSSWITDVKRGEKWALTMLDVQGRPTSSLTRLNRVYLGNFEGCLDLETPHNFSGQYCLLSVNTTATTYKANIYIDMFRYPLVYGGICVPSSCPKEFIERVISNIEFPIIKQNFSQHFEVTIQNGDCYKYGDPIEFTTLNWITIFVFLFILSLSILGTMYDLFCNNSQKDKSSFWAAFSLIKNFQKLFSTKNDPRKSSSIEGFRALNCFLIVINHRIVAMANGNTSNLHYAFALVRQKDLSLFFQFTYNAVESFLVMAGTLTTIKFFTIVQNRKKYDPIWEFLQRYIRFTVPISLLLLYRMGISEHLHIGPLYKGFNNYNRRFCSSSIASILLGYDNLHAPTLACFEQLWHISLDLQLFAASQIILVIGLWKKKAVWIICLVLCLVVAVTEFYIGYIYDMGPTVTITLTLANQLHDYSLPHTRGVPWFAGMFLGYILTNCKNLQPSKTFQTVMWILTTASLVLVYIAPGWFDFESYTQPAAALHLSGHRVLFAFSVCWIIYTLHQNLAKPLENFCSWGLFTFYGKISFEIFLVHLPLIHFIMATARETIEMTIEHSFYDFFPIMFYSTLLAVILALLVTMPCNNLLNTYKNINICPISCKYEKVDEKFL